MSTVENTTYTDVSAAADAADAERIRADHHIGWPSDEDRNAAVGWLADIIVVDDIATSALFRNMRALFRDMPRQHFFVTCERAFS